MFGLFMPLYIYSAQSHELPTLLLKILLVFFPVAGFLLGVAPTYLYEYRGRLSFLSYLGEILLMLVAFVFVGGGLVLGLIAGFKSAESVVHSDGTGLAVLFFLLSGAIVGVIPGIILGALAITIWKFRGNSKGNLSPAVSLFCMI